MSGNPRTFYQKTPLSEVLDRLADDNIGAVLLTDRHNKLTGIFTERDLLLKKPHLQNIDYQLPIQEYMTSQPLTVHPHDNVDICHNIMSKNNIRHLPVVKEEHIIGIVSIKDLTLAREKIFQSLINDTNEENERLMGMICHDLRSPLSNVISYLDLYLAGDIEEDFLKERAPSIMMGLNIAFNLIEDMMDVSKIKDAQLKVNLQSQSLQEVLPSIVEFNRNSANKKEIELSLTADLDLPNIMFDEQRIAQVLNNLINNALKFSQPKTNISIKAIQDESSVILSVTDQGQGIAPDEIKDLFKPFKQTSSKSTQGEKGHGLGLAIVQKVAEAHNGNVEVTSTLGEGSTFSLHFPIPSNSKI